MKFGEKGRNNKVTTNTANIYSKFEQKHGHQEEIIKIVLKFQ